MTKVWSRDHTKDWIAQLENRIEDIDFYLRKTIEWCELHGVYEDHRVFVCSIMTVVWVSQMRGESVSKREAFELLGIADSHLVPDETFEVGAKYSDYDLEDLLYNVTKTF